MAILFCDSRAVIHWPDCVIMAICLNDNNCRLDVKVCWVFRPFYSHSMCYRNANSVTSCDTFSLNKRALSECHFLNGTIFHSHTPWYFNPSLNQMSSNGTFQLGKFYILYRMYTILGYVPVCRYSILVWGVHNELLIKYEYNILAFLWFFCLTWGPYFSLKVSQYFCCSPSWPRSNSVHITLTSPTIDPIFDNFWWMLKGYISTNIFFNLSC